MGLKNNPHERQDTIFATILADGKIHVSVPEGTEGAVFREYETSDGKKGGKWEHVYTELTGLIQKDGLRFHEGEYGLNLLVVVGEEGDEKPVTLALSTESNFGEDMMKKLPNIDLKKPVTLAPYSFLNDRQKKQRGITITQKDKKGESVKIVSFYHDTEKKKTTNGYPAQPVSKKPLSKIQWRKYFTEAREFMIEDLGERMSIPTGNADGESEEDGAARRKSNKEF